jgi:hypothetical protein
VLSGRKGKNRFAADESRNCREAVSTGAFSVELPVEPGKNRVEIWCEDKPLATMPGDRVLLFGLWGFQFEWLDDKN